MMEQLTDIQWLTDEELAGAYDETARDLARQIERLAVEIKRCEDAGDFDAAKRKARLRKLCRQDYNQAMESAAQLRAGLADKPPVGSRRSWRGAAPMGKW